MLVFGVVFASFMVVCNAVWAEPHGTYCASSGLAKTFIFVSGNTYNVSHSMTSVDCADEKYRLAPDGTVIFIGLNDPKDCVGTKLAELGITMTGFYNSSSNVIDLTLTLPGGEVTFFLRTIHDGACDNG